MSDWEQTVITGIDHLKRADPGLWPVIEQAGPPKFRRHKDYFRELFLVLVALNQAIFSTWPPERLM